MTTTPKAALKTLAATAKRARLAPPTKDAQAAWREQWVTRNARGQVVYSCKTWNPDAEANARARAKTCGGTATLIAAGQTGAAA